MNLDIINSGITCKVRTSDALYDDLEVLWLRRNVDFLNSPLIVVDKLSKMVQNKMLIGSKLKIYLKQGIQMSTHNIWFNKLVEVIRMGTHNLCFYNENQNTYHKHY